MATNLQIIMNEKFERGIDLELPCATFAEWRRCGYSVKKGEKAAFSTMLWKVRPRKKDESDEEYNAKNRYIMVKAYIFTKDQVERIK